MSYSLILGEQSRPAPEHQVHQPKVVDYGKSLPIHWNNCHCHVRDPRWSCDWHCGVDEPQLRRLRAFAERRASWDQWYQPRGGRFWRAEEPFQLAEPDPWRPDLQWDQFSELLRPKLGPCCSFYHVLKLWKNDNCIKFFVVNSLKSWQFHGRDRERKRVTSDENEREICYCFRKKKWNGIEMNDLGFLFRNC